MTREKGRGILRIVKESEVALGGPVSQAFSIWTGRIITTARLAVKITSVETKVGNTGMAVGVSREVGGV